MYKKIVLASLLSFFVVFAIKTDTYAYSVPYANTVYIWRSGWIYPSPPQMYQIGNQGKVNTKQYMYSGIGTQFLGRIQFSLNGASNLSSYTSLNLKFALKTEDGAFSSIIPSARLNNNGYTSGNCLVDKFNSKQLNFNCSYIYHGSHWDLSTLWVDLGRLSVEVGSNPTQSPNIFFFAGEKIWIEYLDFNYTTGLSESDKIIQEQNNIIKEQNNAINKQIQQQKDQYDFDKAEQQNRENQGKDSSNELSGLFKFQILNPFVAIFGLFQSPNSCVKVPILASWFKVSNPTYCSWFPATVRNTLTPVFSITSTMIIFGFVVRWMSGSNVDGTIKIGGKK